MFHNIVEFILVSAWMDFCFEDIASSQNHLRFFYDLRDMMVLNLLVRYFRLFEWGT